MLYFKTRFNKGFSIIEMILYISILTFMLAIIANILFSITRSERSIKSSKMVESSAISVLNRIILETRGAVSVDMGSSVLDTSPGTLVLNSIDGSGNNRKVEFFLTAGSLHERENGIDLGSLSNASSTVTRAVFSLLTGTSSQAVKIEITIEHGTSTSYRSEKFYSTTILRGSI